MNLSEKELTIIQDADFFRVKQQIIQKTLIELNNLRDEVKKTAAFQNFDFPEEMDIEYGKISKGENYNSLPWIVLDFPRRFNKNGVFAFRSMFLWGKGFFFTLHLSGQYLENYKTLILSKVPELKSHQVYFYTDSDEWQHEVILPFYQQLNQITPDKIQSSLQNQTYCKLARRLELSNIQNLTAFGLETFELFFKGLNMISS